MSVPLTAAFFSALLNKSFSLAELPTVSLELVSVEEFNWSTPAHPAFSLRFRGPRTPELVQRIHALEGAATGIIDIFLVPIARDAEAMHYEAVFN